jgi:hypothetical protein
MTDFARLVLDADTRGLKQGERELDRVGKQAKRTADDVDGAAVGMSSAFKKVGVALVAAGIGNVIFDFGKKSVQAAIDAEEMGSAFNVVFGNMAGDVRKWAEETGNALGRSTQEIMRGTLAFQELFGKALDPAQAAEMSKQFAVLTQDLASFKNLSNEVAQQKLFAGLVGEAEPLRAVGVFLNEAAVQAKAAELGLAGVNGVLTDQEKIVARAAIIQEQLALAQGDVERTSGSTANQIKTMNAAVEELQVAVGQKLLPQLTPLITVTAELITMMANAAQTINVTAQSTQDFVQGLRILGGWLKSSGAAFYVLSNATGLTGERMSWLYERARLLINPLATVASLIERVGGASRASASRDAIGLGSGPLSLSSINIAGELAAMGKGAAAVNAPSGLPAISANLDKVGASAGRASAGIRDTRDEMADLLEQLYPENTTRRQMSQLEMVSANSKRTAEQIAEDRRRILGISGEVDVSRDLITQGPLEAAKRVVAANDDIGKSLEELQGKSKITTVSVADSFAQMSQRITSSLQGLTNSIRNGDFLGILGGVLDIFMQLGSLGAFGSGLQGRLNAPVSGSRANGGQVNAGRSYLVGERGPELFTPPGHGRIHSNDNLGGRVHVTVGVDPRSGNLTAFVNDQIAATAPAIAGAGAAMAQGQMAARQARRVR